MKIYKYLLIGVLAAVLAGLIFFNSTDLKPIRAEQISADAIAIRVMPNSDHQSPLRWYQANVKNQGTPQNLTVDGYEAVRDGRTVYVNASNVSGGSLFTNVYLLSYSQGAEKATEDIFGQLLAHWKFNVNLSPGGKANAISDTRRLADLYDLNLALAGYKNSHGGKAPALAAGSYLAGKSISKWPSWQATLGAELGITMPLDPVNKLNDCPGYADKTTCWDQNDKTFYFNFNSATDPKSVAGSPVYWYADGVFQVNLINSY